MINKKFELAGISREFTGVVKTVREIINNENTDLLLEFEKRILELKENKTVKVAFIGQYSAGKSTIISALTGNKNIIIGADIATDETSDYNWNDIVLTDTPGLYTDRSEHDEITERKIEESDLLVYCLTSDLFDNIVLNNFKKLAFEKGYANKMLLIVNKMSAEAGEYEVLIENYTSSISEALKPYDINKMSVSFIDAADYIEGIDDKEEDLIELSRFDNLIDKLNEFVKNKGLLGKYDAPIRVLMTLIDDLLEELFIEEDKELFQTIKRIEYKIKRGKDKVENDIKRRINGLSMFIIRQSDAIIQNMADKDSNMQDELDKIQKDIESEVEKYRNEILDYTEEQYSELQSEVGDVLESDIARFVFESIDTGNIKLEENELNDFSKILSNFEKIDGSSKTVTSSIGKLTGTTNGGLAKASQVAGSKGHDIVLNVGKFFGTKFKPWQAVNIAKNIGNVAKVLGPVISIIGLFIDVADTVNEEKNVKKLAEAKKECYYEFVKVAENIEKEFISNLNKYQASTYIKLLDDINMLKNSIISHRKSNKEKSDNLVACKQNAEKLLEKIYM